VVYSLRQRDGRGEEVKLEWWEQLLMTCFIVGVAATLSVGLIALGKLAVLLVTL
jgi:hypothetical protein